MVVKVMLLKRRRQIDKRRKHTDRLLVEVRLLSFLLQTPPADDLQETGVLDKVCQLFLSDRILIQPNAPKRILQMNTHSLQVGLSAGFVDVLEGDVGRRGGLHVGQRRRDGEQSRGVRWRVDERPEGVEEQEKGLGLKTEAGSGSRRR